MKEIIELLRAREYEETHFADFIIDLQRKGISDTAIREFRTFLKEVPIMGCDYNGTVFYGNEIMQFRTKCGSFGSISARNGHSIFVPIFNYRGIQRKVNQNK